MGAHAIAPVRAALRLQLLGRVQGLGARPAVARLAEQMGLAAWCNGQHCMRGPHVGDLESLSTRERFLQQLAGIERLYRFTPDAFACDRHPGYFTSDWAARSRMPRIEMLHHQAHVAAGMLEHGYECRAQTSSSAMAMRFHRAVAAGVASVVRKWPGLPVVFGGGVFQNRLLTDLVVAELNETRKLCLPGAIPPNDGGLAAGQLAIALSERPGIR
jgi:hydrogenase maturation factor HypF (carbamoyltransferase family)